MLYPVISSMASSSLEKKSRRSDTYVSSLSNAHLAPYAITQSRCSYMKLIGWVVSFLR